MLLTDYKVNGRRSAYKLVSRLNHLRAHFGIDRAVDITADRVQRYVVQRQQEGARNATINRELAALKRAFALAVKVDKLGHAPHIACWRSRTLGKASLITTNSCPCASTYQSI